MKLSLPSYDWMKSPKMGIGMFVLIVSLLYVFAMIPVESSSPHEYMNRAPVSQMVAGASRQKEMARQDFAESARVIGNTFEDSVVSKYFPPAPIPTDMAYKLRNVTPYLSSI